jgi:GNAT superfamily N-acetyltransferase
LSDEVPAMAELYYNVWHETQALFMPEQERCRRTLSFFLDRMLPLTPTTLVGRKGGDLAGFVSWRGDYLGQIFVLPQYRGCGLAKDLLIAAEHAIASAGSADAELHCVVGNERAYRFYIRNGWRNDGMISEPVAGSDGDAHVSFWRLTKRLQ